MMNLLTNKYLITIVIAIIACVVGLVSIKYFGNGNPIEEIAEEVIKEETGINVDLDQKVSSSQVSTPVQSDTKTTPTDTTSTPPNPSLGSSSGGITYP